MSAAVIGAEPLKGLAVGDLLKVYAELGWGDVRDDFKKLNLELKRPATTATTVNSAPVALAPQTVDVDVTAKRLHPSAAAVAAAERAELLMSAIHLEDEDHRHGEPAVSKLGEERALQDGFAVSSTTCQLQSLKLLIC